MITVASFNTAVDKYLEVETLSVGGIVRASGVRALPGGKGIHVAVTCAALGEPVRLVGLIDSPHRVGFTRFLAERGVDCRWVEVDAIRTCLAIRDSAGNTTEVLEPGPQVDSSAREALASQLVERARESTVTVLSGSLALGFPEDFYGSLIRTLRPAATRCILDASGASLRAGLEAKPYLVKPNRDEASQVVGRPLRDTVDAASAAGEIARGGVRVAVISLGAEGLVASWEGRACWVCAPPVEVVNTVGAGDCLVGGLAVGIVRGLDSETLLRLGAACGAAKALHPGTGVLSVADVEWIAPKVRLEWVEA